MKLSSQVLEELLDFGRSNDNDDRPPSLRDAKTAWRTLMCGNAPWLEAARHIGVSNVPDLIRGLVRYSRVPGRGLGGSVSPVIVLYRLVVEQLPSAEPELTRWVVAHRINPYEPFGTLRDEGGATKYADYAVRRSIRVGRTRANEAREAERQQSALSARREREKKQSTERLANAIRRGDLAAVRALLDKGADAQAAALPNGGSLVGLALKNERVAVSDFLKSRGIR